MAPTKGFSLLSLRVRLGAAGIHLGLSAAAVGALALLMWLLWYPPPYFFADGGWRVLHVIIWVDVVLGPLLTLIVFDRAKPELKRDLAIIVALQCAALAYGAATMYLHRPVFLAAAGSNLFTVNWRDLEKAGGDLAPARALAAAGSTPLLVRLELPSSPAEREKLWTDAARGGIPPIHQAARYRAASPQWIATFLGAGADVEALAKTDAGIAAEFASVQARHPGIPRARMAFVPLTCRFDVVMLVFDRQTGKLIDWME